MIMVSCTQDNIEIEQEDNRTFIVSAAMPKADDAQTRVSLTPDAEYNWLLLYGQKLAAGESIVVYRWVASLPDVPQLIGEALFRGNAKPETPTRTDARTVTNGNVYHIGLIWDGADLTWGY